jgi:hypothetical protein
MRILCALVVLLVGCTVVPNSKVAPTPPPVAPASFVKLQPPMPALARSFALSETVVWNPPPDTNNVYISPVPTNAPSFGTIKLLFKDKAVVQWLNWPTNAAYRIEASYDLTKWQEFSSGISGTNGTTNGTTRIIIMDFGIDDTPTFFYRLVQP